MKNLKAILTDPFAFFVYGCIVVAILFAIFGWGKPASVNNFADVQAVETLLNNDSTHVTITRFSEVETLNGQDVQSVFYTIKEDSTSTEKVAIVNVKKGFLKYKVAGLHK